MTPIFVDGLGTHTKRQGNRHQIILLNKLAQALSKIIEQSRCNISTTNSKLATDFIHFHDLLFDVAVIQLQ